MSQSETRTDRTANGRDRRLTDVRCKAWASRDIKRVIRAFCFECMGGHLQEIDQCTAPECPLFHWRGVTSIREGFDLAANALEREGLSDLAASSRRKLQSSRESWTDRKKTNQDRERGVVDTSNETAPPASEDE
jgi:hypothetical protein